jgi:transcription elongation factor Elf1
MSIYVDRKYIGLIQYRLEGFVQKKPDLYNFRCPFCLDSKKSKTKLRGYIYKLQKVEALAYRCHNCGMSISFGHLLEFIDGATYKQYVLEKYCEGGNKHTPVEKPTFSNLKGNAAEYFRNHPKNLGESSIWNLPEDHPARSYIESRRIPEKFWDEIYYTDTFLDFMREEFPDFMKKESPDPKKIEEKIPNDKRIVLLYTDHGGYVTHVAGRSLDPNNKLRYITIKVSDEDRKIFGSHRLTDGKPAYVVEGQFDSMFLDNCVASGDSNLSGVVDALPDNDWTLVFDNEPRNKEIVRGLERAIDRGYKVVVYPDTIEQKDINDMVLAGVDVKTLVRENTHKGAIAMLKFLKWKRV